jgi:hypothetical protein
MMNRIKARRTAMVVAVCAGGVLGAAPAMAEPAPFDYTETAWCEYSPTAEGSAYVGRAPRGTARVEYTMRTGIPEAWDAVTVTAESKPRRWGVTTPAGTSFINWLKFYDASGSLIGEQMVNVRCEGTPEDWPR